MIPVTWDIFYEKWGFMLIYWNLSGVPFVYRLIFILIVISHSYLNLKLRILILSFCSTGSFVIQKIGLIELPYAFKVYLLVSFLFVYWVWDTANSQKVNTTHTSTYTHTHMIY